MSYEEDIQIDKYRLDEHLEDHNSLIYKYNQLYIDATTEKEFAEEKVFYLKEQVKIVSAELFLEVKNNWREHGFDKPPSDKVCGEWVLTQDKYKNILNEWLQARKEAVKAREIWKNNELANDNIKSMDYKISHLCDLWQMGYYGGDKKQNAVERNSKKKEKQEENFQKNMKEKLKKRMMV